MEFVRGQLVVQNVFVKKKPSFVLDSCIIHVCLPNLADTSSGIDMMGALMSQEFSFLVVLMGGFI